MKEKSQTQKITAECGMIQEIFSGGLASKLEDQEKVILSRRNSIYEASEVGGACFRPEERALGRSTGTQGTVCSQTTDMFIISVICWRESKRKIVIWPDICTSRNMKEMGYARNTQGEFVLFFFSWCCMLTPYSCCLCYGSSLLCPSRGKCTRLAFSCWYFLHPSCAQSLWLWLLDPIILEIVS